MKFVRLITLVLALGLSVYGQALNVTANKVQVGTPSGACTAGSVRVTTTGMLYTCVSGTWTGGAGESIATNVKTDYGAVCDGSTDDTTAIQNALNGSRNIFIPIGTCIASNLAVALDNTRIFGAGSGSIIQMKTGSTGALIASGAHPMTLESLTLYGGSNSTKAATASSSADRTGLSIETQRNSVVSRVTIYGFTNFGLLMADTARDKLAHIVVSDSAIYHNWTNLKLGDNYAEYIRLSNLDVYGGRYGLYLSSGNITITNSKITENGYGVYVLGTGIGNNAHGNVSNSLINHNTVYSIWTEGVTNGFNFIGNNIFDGDIYLQTSSGINIQSGIIDVANYLLEGGGRNYIRNNFIVGSAANTVTHNYNAVSDNTVLVDNYKTAGTAVEAFSATLASNLGLSLTPSTITVALPGFKLAGTLSGSGAQGAVIDMTSSGSSGIQKAAQFRLNAGYTGAQSIGMELLNGAAGTGTSLELATSFNNPSGNSGLNAFAWATTAGSNAAAYAEALGGNINAGVVGKAITTKNSAANVGVIGLGVNAGTSPIQIGGFFGQMTTQATVISESAALIADNGAQTTPIFLARDNGTTVFSVLDGGDVKAVSGDIAVMTTTKGLILKSPDGTCYRFTVANGGALSAGASVTCP